MINQATKIPNAGIAAVCLLCAQSTLAVTSPKTEGDWFLNLLKNNQGTAFCLPNTTRVIDAAKVVKAYVDAHPEMNGNINTLQTIQVLADAHPCPSQDTNQEKNDTVESLAQQDKSAKYIMPIFSQLLTTSFPKGFKTVFENTNGPHYINESVLEGENENNWSQMFTITGVKGLASNPDMSPKKYSEMIAARYKKACPKSFAIGVFDEEKIGGFDSFTAILSCGTSSSTAVKTSESAVITVIKGEADYYTIQWAERTDPSSRPMVIDQAKWVGRLKKLAPVKLCPIVPGEQAPYPSCIGSN